MATGKRPDPRRRMCRHPHSTAFKIPAGTKDSGYKAGEVYGCYTHRTFAAQACSMNITDGAIPCKYCAVNTPSVWTGYLPVWDCDFTLRHAVFNENYLESVDAIPFHGQVVLSRGKDPKNPLIIREAPSTFRALPNKAPWKHEVCMLAVCLTLWQNPELTRWVEANQPLALASCAPPPPPAKPVAKVTPYKAPRGDGPSETDFAEQVNRITGKAAHLKPSTNGDHK